MSSSRFLTCPFMSRLGFYMAMAMLCALAFSESGYSQSTFGTVLGTVKDPSGSVVPGVKIDLLNTGTNADRSTQSKSDGSYEFVNVEIGTYKLQTEATGFQSTQFKPFDLTARATVRIDIDLQVSSQVTTVNVEAVSVVQTDSSNVAETKGSLELTNLPVAIGTRSAGSTSAFSTLTAQPGCRSTATTTSRLRERDLLSFRSVSMASAPSDRGA